MVTYLLEESHGPAATFTQEGMQLEAYCSGIGKVLLAHLDEDRRERYLADGPFVALTPSTIVKPSALRDHLAIVKAQGWAVDDSEVFETLKCVAAPLRCSDGTVVAAVSISSPAGLADDAYEHALVTLLEAVTTIEAKLTHAAHAKPD
jgi:IclR family transcriptional regulator, acetate operon repressor